MKIHLIYLQICSMSVHMIFDIGVLDYAVRLRKNSCHVCSPRSYSACSIMVNVIWLNQTKTKRKEKPKTKTTYCSAFLVEIRNAFLIQERDLSIFPPMDGEGLFVPGWYSIPLKIEIGLQPFSNPWSMFSQYFRSSGEKTKSRSRICKPSELILIGEEISRNVNVRPSSPQVMVDSFATDSVFIAPSAWLQMLRGENLSTG